ncbi:hypothetical protein RND81_04G134600 [Saponaria officinalis]|uniref:PRA1 family protein n=1 Tax=Saponaria officinalis TaxID=3572 RepID=A0AAW1LML3_SAPOF
MSSSTPDDTTAAATTRPWSEFFSTTALSLPVSISDATSRIKLNLIFFKLNYINLFIIIFFISLFAHPLSLLILFLTALAWHFLFVNRRDAALEVAGFEIGDRVVAAVLGGVTVVALVYADVWVNLFVSIAVSVVIVLVHAVVRVPSFGDDDPYGGLLDAESGGYSQF